MENIKLSVGQKLWLVRSHHYRGNNRNPIEVIISKVGNKYFELEEYNRSKFYIETLQLSTESNYIDKCYLTLQEILDEREFNNLVSNIKVFFNGYGKLNLTLEDCRNIMGIINKV